VVGLGPAVLGVVRNLRLVNWPVTVHDPDGAPTLAFMPGVHIATSPPGQQLLRQASLVIIGAQAPILWREEALRDLQETGIAFWDESNPTASTLAFPSWLPGRSFSLALWGEGIRGGWQENLAGDFLQGIEGLYVSFFSLVEELRTLVFDGMPDEEFRNRVVSQVARPEILTLLLNGERERAKIAVLKIVGSTTRTL
jgi:hypothetical protein